MAVTLRFETAPQYLAAILSGPASLDDFFAGIDAIARETLDRGAARLLVDLREVQEQFRFTDHFSVGERVASRLGHLERIASLVPPQRRTGTSEQVANQKGRLLRVFTIEPDAVAWLSEP
jgi:hypothetical protein